MWCLYCTDSRSSSKKKKGRGLQGASEQGGGDRAAAAATATETRDRSSSGATPSQEAVNTPRKILKKDGHEQQLTESKPRKEKPESKGKHAKSSEVCLPHFHYFSRIKVTMDHYYGFGARGNQEA